MNVPNLRNDERISQQLQVLTNASIPIHQNFFEVVSSVAPTTSSAANNEVQQPTVSQTKKRGRPPKNINRISTSSQPNTNSAEMINSEAQNSQNTYNLRKRK